MTLPILHHSRRTIALAALGLTTVLSGCHTTPPADDASLNTAVASRLHSDAAIANEPIQASVQAAVATLSGPVSSEAARSLAANDVAGVPGIRTVINNLSVAQLPVSQQAAILPPPPTETITAPPPAPVRTLSRKPAPAIDRRQNVAPIQRQQPPTATPPSPQSAPQVAHNTPPPPPPGPTFHDVTIPSGTAIPVRISQTLDSASTQQGETFSGSIANDILIDGLVAIPQGSSVSGRVDTVQEAAHFKGNSLLAIELTSINRRGDPLSVTTDTFSKAGAGRGKNTAEKVGGGAAVGAILGGILGGGKGAGIGAAAGGGLGAGANTITRGQQVQIPSETLVRFNLTSPVTVRVRTSPGTESRTPVQPQNPDPSGRRPLN